jgi:hypothetical protein
MGINMREDYQLMVKTYEEAGGKPSAFSDSRIAHLVVHENKILGSHLVDGLHMNAKETEHGVDVEMTLDKGVRLAHQVHLCFGVLPEEGRQEIKVRALIHEGAEIAVLAHCVFPNAVKVQHLMDGDVVLEDNAVFRYDEVHYHGQTGGIEVVPRINIKVGKGARLTMTFSLLKGRVGKLDVDYLAEVEENGSVEMIAKAYGYGDDKIKVRERCRLVGDGAKGLLKSRIAVREKAESEVVSELEACAPNSRGHVDCIEIVQDEAKARAVPLVNVLNDKAQVTHEAAIGRVNQKELETLMARGLNQEEAIDTIIGGMLK